MTLRTRSVLSGLFRYRESAERSPREDFLSEAFCHLLNLLDEERRTQEALQKLLGLGKIAADRIDWRTQFVIPATAGLPSGKRPDIAGQHPDAPGTIIIIENKIAAPFTEHELPGGEGSTNQVVLYCDYARKYQNSAVCFLTHRTAPPADAADTGMHVVTWQQVHKALSELTGAKERRSPADRFAEELRVFLEEHNMAQIKLGLEEIAAYSVWRESREKLGELGETWHLIANHPLHEKLKSGGFAATSRYGEFHWGNCALFSGTLFTPADEKGRGSAANHSNVFFYFGALIDTVYGCVAPVMDGVPEFTTGFAVWHEGPNGYEHDYADLQAIQESLAGANEGWTLRQAQDGSTKVTVLARSHPFLSLYKPDLDWAAQAEDFYYRTLEEVGTLSEKQLAALIKMGG